MSSAATPPQSDARPVVAIFDLDRTVTRRGTYTPFLFAVACQQPSSFRHLPAILAATAAYKTGSLSRGRLKEVMLTRVMGAMTRAEVAAHASRFVDDEVAVRLRPGAVAAIDAHRRAGHRLILMTASFDFYAELFRAALGLDSVIATRAEWDHADRLTGRIIGENCYGDAKLRALAAAEPGLAGRCRVIAYSDHHSDAPLLAVADEAVAVNPSRRLRRLASERGYRIADWG
jgi:HAD superfamily hydrolase (TIGR01490 family)